MSRACNSDRLEQVPWEECKCLFDGSEANWADQPIADGPMTVGIDGAMVPAHHKAGSFEVIAGKSIVAFTCEEADANPSAKRFVFAQTYDTKPRRRVWELMNSQGLQKNQEVLFLSDGGETVRNLRACLHPSSKHSLDWFHITRWFTVMKQQHKALTEKDTLFGTDVDTTLDSVKRYLWHGNVEAALERLENLSFNLGINRRRSAALAKLSRSVTEFETYVQNDHAFIPNYGERYRHRDTISTAFVESTINQVVSTRVATTQQRKWRALGRATSSLRHEPLGLNGDLNAPFGDWYPQFEQAAA